MAIFSIDLEKQLIAGLLQYPDKYFEIPFISSSDFYTGEKNDETLHKNIFSIISSCIEENGTADDAVVASRAKALGVSGKGDVSVWDYVSSLSLRTINPNKVESIAKELKKYTVRRDCFLAARATAVAVRDMDASSSYEEILRLSDETFNSKIAAFDTTNSKPVNIFEKMEELVEDRGNNPIKIKGFNGPHPILTKIYGSILRPGNITVVVARSGVGKTNWLLDYCTRASEMNGDVPILHLDNGEMSEEELIMRQCSAMSGVPLHLLETGDWRRAGDEIVDKVRSVFSKIKSGEKIRAKMFYFNVAGMSIDQMISTTRRFYYNEIGRGNQMILAFDYFKTTGQQMKGMSEWAVVGEMVDKFKQLIHKEILFNDEPVISMMSAVQANRSGIVTNKTSESIIDDESIVSLSDRIIQFCSHLLILRKKADDEIVRDGRDFGTHKCIFLKYRHLGEDTAGALEPVMINDKPQQNALHFDVKNFCFSECGDTRDLKKKLGQSTEVTSADYNENPDNLPM